MTSHDVITELNRLGLPRGQYVVVGGAALAVRGIRETDDIDVVVTTELFEKLAESGWVLQLRPNGKPGLHRGSVEAYLDVDGDDFKRSLSWLLSRAEILRGHAFVDLETLAGFKASYGREKDLQDLNLIAAHVSGGTDFADTVQKQSDIDEHQRKECSDGELRKGWSRSTCE